jgi:glycerol-3-phosphate acyltransferase PlsY
LSVVVTPADAVAIAIAAVLGYLAGSVPLAGWIWRRSGVALPGSDGLRTAGATGAAVWRAVGPGWGLLAVAGELAQGVLPVALGLATWSWTAGWAAGLGAIVGTAWPLFGRLPRRRAGAVPVGVLVTLAPAAGILSAMLALPAFLLARAAGRGGLVGAGVVGYGSYPVLLYAAEIPVPQLVAVLLLYLVTAVGSLAWDRRARDT